MERNNFDSSKERVVTIDCLWSSLSLGSVVESRPVARPFRKVRAKAFAFFQAVDILRVISDKATAIAEGSDELVGCCC
jgi:hypothetical protein